MTTIISNIILVQLFFTGTLMAQTYNVTDWKKEARLPAYEQGTAHNGLAGPVAGYHNGFLVVGGGANFPGEMPWNGGQKKYYGDLYIYKQKATQLVLHQHAQLPFELAYPAVCSSSYGVIFAGGENEQGQLNTVRLISIGEEGTPEVRKLPDLPLPLSSPAMAVLGDQLYLAGGDGEQGTSDQLFTLNLAAASPAWKALASLPLAVSNTVLVASKSSEGGKLILAGGRVACKGELTTFYAGTYEYDVKEDRWARKADLPYPLAAGAGWLAGDDLFLFGGDRGLVYNDTERLIYRINEAKEERLKQRLLNEKARLQQQHPGFSREILRYSLRDDRWSAAAELPFETPVTTAAVGTPDRVFLVSGEIRAGVRSPYIRSGRVKAIKK